MTEDLFFDDTFDSSSFLGRLDAKIANSEELQNQHDSATPDLLEEGPKSTLQQDKVDSVVFDDTFFLSESLSFNVENNVSSSNCSINASFQSKTVTTKCKVISDESLQNTEKCSEFIGTQRLSEWGLPESILQKYKERKVTNMFHWQVECLSLEGVMKNSTNLVYSAPTSAGKTLVAEILAIKTVLERKKKVLFILPFVSVVREKMFYFQEILSANGVRVEGFMGSYNPPGGFQKVQIAICTMEKANNLINRMLEEGCLSDVGAVVIDEMHLLGDASRGYLLELLLTKLRYMSAKDESLKIQIIGMSATLPNLNTLAAWLNAQLYTTNFRPIPLDERVLVSSEIYDNELKLTRVLQPKPELMADTDNILQLCLETICENCSVLIFCPTKNWCENLSQQIALAFCKLGNSSSELGESLRNQLNTDAIIELLEQLKRCPVGLDKVLAKAVSFGVAFHHAGLTMDERDIIESAFRCGALRVLVATSTLSSGVNLPARRVIIRTPMFHGKPIDTLTYRQMIGRAGRMGRDTAGESILICQKNDYAIARELLSANLSPIESCLEESGRLKRAVLEVIASGVASTPGDIKLFTSCTLLAMGNTEDVGLSNPITETVEFLQRNEFIRLQTTADGSSRYIATGLGKACLSSSLPPEEGLALFAELEKARQCFVLDTELHLIYLVTPYSACYQWNNLDWMLFLDLWQKLPTSMKRVGELVGVRESYIVNATRGKIQTNTSKLHQKLMVHKRFYTALALQDLVNELPLNEVATKFNCNRGMLQSLQQSASSFAGMVTAFSKQLGWSSVEILISQFQDRLQFGISRDLLDLMRLPLLTGHKARALYNAGIETLVDLASTDVCGLENVLQRALPFESDRLQEDGNVFTKKAALKTVWIAGKQGLTEREAAEILINEARRFLLLEMGVARAEWDAATSGNQQDFVNANNKNEEEQEFELKLSPASSTTTIDLDLEQNIPETEANNLSSGPSTTKIDVDLEQNIPESDALPGSSTKKINLGLEQNIFETEFNNFPSGFSTKKINIDLEQNIPETEPNNFSPGSFITNVDLEIEPNNLSSASSTTTMNQNLFLEQNITRTASDESLFDESMEKQDENPENCHEDSGLSDDFIANSQVECVSIIKDCTPVKLHSPKKRERVSSVFGGSPNETPTKKSRSDRTEELNVRFKRVLNVSDKKDQFDTMEIIEVCDDENLFQTFCKELRQTSVMSLSVACSKIEETKQVIGLRTANVNANHGTPEGFHNKNRQLDGIALSWGENTVYYVNFNNTCKISNMQKLNLLKSVFANRLKTLRIFDCKEQLKVLNECCGVTVDCSVEDPRVADWLLDPEGREKNLQAMTVRYTPSIVELAQLAGACKRNGSVGLELTSSIHPKIRASVESTTTFHLIDAVRSVLAQQDFRLLDIYDIEMKVSVCLASMEVEGIGVNTANLNVLISTLKQQQVHLEKHAFSLAGRRFSLTSSRDVARVVGIYRGKKVSTSKQVLEKTENPIASVVLKWRKLNGILTKMIFPLLRMIENERIHGCCITHSATGRITMHEPNLQNVARDFEIVNPVSKKTVRISCRGVFLCREGCVLLSADYCQLELRLLSHFAEDSLLCAVMRTKEDVFKSIAAKWNNVTERQVSDVQRQHAKQICYGIIYGMGAKTLAEQLEVEEEIAVEFMESFHRKYPGIKKYIQRVIEKAKRVEYVETFTGRRRYLPSINHENPAIRSQAERQAVNTTIQGSAADIAKKAMVIIARRLNDVYQTSPAKPKLVLHLHDELLYEVPAKQLMNVARIVKKSMEESVNLSIPFPVKLKSGVSWGQLKEFVLH